VTTDSETAKDVGGDASIEGESSPAEPHLSRRQRRKNRPMTRGRYLRRRIVVGAGAVIALAAIWFGVTFLPYVRDSNGEPTSVLLAEWGRDNHLGPVVAKAEDFYYAHSPSGGSPPRERWSASRRQGRPPSRPSRRTPI